MDTISRPESKTPPLIPNIRSVVDNQYYLSVTKFPFVGFQRRYSDWPCPYLEVDESTQIHWTEAANTSRVEEGLKEFNVTRLYYDTFDS